MTAELADDRRDGVRTEVASAFDVEPVDRLDQPDRAGLNEIVGLLGGTREAAGQRPDERQVPLDRLLPRRPVVGAVVPRKQLERVELSMSEPFHPHFHLIPYIPITSL